MDATAHNFRIEENPGTDEISIRKTNRKYGNNPVIGVINTQNKTYRTKRDNSEGDAHLQKNMGGAVGISAKVIQDILPDYNIQTIEVKYIRKDKTYELRKEPFQVFKKKAIVEEFNPGDPQYFRRLVEIGSNCRSVGGRANHFNTDGERIKKMPPAREYDPSKAEFLTNEEIDNENYKTLDEFQEDKEENQTTKGQNQLNNFQ